MLSEPEAERLRNLLQEKVGDRERLTLRQGRELAAAAGVSLLAAEWLALGEGLMPERYERNMGTIGPDGQRKLLESRAGVVGLGGIGGHVVESVARLGVGRIVGIDGDVFAESNLNRQVLATEESLGSAKTERAAVRVGLVNPAVEFIGHPVPFEQVGEEVLRECSVVFDCLDSIPGRLELAGRCARAGVTLVHGAIAGWSGQVAACRPGSGLLSRLYGEGKRGIEGRLGNLAFTAAVAANLMVALAVPVLLGREPPSADEVLFFDLMEQEWEAVQL